MESISINPYQLLGVTIHSIKKLKLKVVAYINI